MTYAKSKPSATIRDPQGARRPSPRSAKSDTNGARATKTPSLPTPKKPSAPREVSKRTALRARGAVDKASGVQAKSTKGQLRDETRVSAASKKSALSEAGRTPLAQPKGESAKAVAAKAVATKAVATKAVATKAVATKAVATKAVATKAVATKAVATKAVAAKAVAAKAALSQAASAAAASTKAVAAKATSTKAASTKVVPGNPATAKAVVSSAQPAKKSPTGASAKARAGKGTNAEPLVDTAAKLRPIEQAVGVSSDAVARRTGKSWAEWFALLDAAGAAELDHKGIVAVLAQRHGVGPWWQQMVTVAYEQARGKNGKQASDDGFQVDLVKTLELPLAKLYRLWAEPSERNKWLADDRFSIHKCTASKSIRARWGRGMSRIDVDFCEKGPSKSQVTVQHNRIETADAAEQMKAYWAKKLGALEALLIARL